MGSGAWFVVVGVSGHSLEPQDRDGPPSGWPYSRQHRRSTHPQDRDFTLHTRHCRPRQTVDTTAHKHLLARNTHDLFCPVTHRHPRVQPLPHIYHGCYQTILCFTSVQPRLSKPQPHPLDADIQRLRVSMKALRHQILNCCVHAGHPHAQPRTDVIYGYHSCSDRGSRTTLELTASPVATAPASFIASANI